MAVNSALCLLPSLLALSPLIDTMPRPLIKSSLYSARSHTGFQLASVVARSLVDKEDAHRAMLCYNTIKWVIILSKHPSIASPASQFAQISKQASLAVAPLSQRIPCSLTEYNPPLLYHGYITRSLVLRQLCVGEQCLTLCPVLRLSCRIYCVQIVNKLLLPFFNLSICFPAMSEWLTAPARASQITHCHPDRDK